MAETIIAHPAQHVRTTQHFRCDYEFLGLLNKDFDIDFFSLNRTFMGVPPVPKKQAISLCEWAIRVAKGDAEEVGRALRVWAKKMARASMTVGSSRHQRSLTITTNTCRALDSFRAGLINHSDALTNTYTTIEALPEG